MKRIIPILLSVAILFALAGCGPSGYLHSTDGDIVVSLPEGIDSDDFVLPEEATALLGKWTLISITKGENTETFENSYYIFYDDGNVTLKVGEQQDAKQKFRFEETQLYIAGHPVTFAVENDTLTITNADGTVHSLTKAADQPTQ